jgi:hypothetical protein
MDKFKSYTRAQVEFALADCHETLRVGGYSVDHPYGKKLWAEIDALRDRSAVLLRDKGRVHLVDLIAQRNHRRAEQRNAEWVREAHEE